MKKKGLLLAEETLKMIIALIAISFLIYFLTSLYFANANSQKLREAESTLSRISDVINNINLNAEAIDALNPSGWYLFSFTQDKKPNACSGENCLCICDNVLVDSGLFGLISDRQIKECNQNGVCEIVENLEEFGEIEIERDFSLEIEKIGDKIIIRGK